LLTTAIEHNYCAYESLQADPLLAKLRGTPVFSELQSAGKRCQQGSGAARPQSLIENNSDPDAHGRVKDLHIP
jgi:hypothetical protein